MSLGIGLGLQAVLLDAGVVFVRARGGRVSFGGFLEFLPMQQRALLREAA